jgi:hypothetical protein
MEPAMLNHETPRAATEQAAIIESELRRLAQACAETRARKAALPVEDLAVRMRDARRLLTAAGIEPSQMPERHFHVLLCAVANEDVEARVKLVSALSWLSRQPGHSVD